LGDYVDFRKQSMETKLVWTKDFFIDLFLLNELKFHKQWAHELKLNVPPQQSRLHNTWYTRLKKLGKKSTTLAIASQLKFSLWKTTRLNLPRGQFLYGKQQDWTYLGEFLREREGTHQQP
jgi:hypothetical protein